MLTQLLCGWSASIDARSAVGEPQRVLLVNWQAVCAVAGNSTSRCRECDRRERSTLVSQRNSSAKPGIMDPKSLSRLEKWKSGSSKRIPDIVNNYGCNPAFCKPADLSSGGAISQSFLRGAKRSQGNSLRNIEPASWDPLDWDEMTILA